MPLHFRKTESEVCGAAGSGPPSGGRVCATLASILRRPKQQTDGFAHPVRSREAPDECFGEAQRFNGSNWPAPTPGSWRKGVRDEWIDPYMFRDGIWTGNCYGTRPLSDAAL
jgi:hypothetical protein